MNTDLPWAAELYAQYPQVEGVAIWYLGPGYGNIANKAQQLIAPMADWAQRTYYVIPMAGGNRAPIAQFTATPTSGNIPLTVQFNASASYDPDGDPITCSWEFGDGQSASGTIVSHTYQQAGTFIARLKVRDSHGTEAHQVRSIEAIDPNAIVVWQVIKEEYFDTYNDWYDQGMQQVRNGWTLWNDTGHNPLGNPNYNEPWNDWAYPEGTFNWDAFIPEPERPLFLNERGFCYKIFCAYGAWHSKFITPNMQLTPGTYRLRMLYWADIVHHYGNC